MDSKLRRVPPPGEAGAQPRRRRDRPAAWAGVLWLLTAGVIGLMVIGLVLARWLVVAPFWAVPAALLAALGYGLITRPGPRLPLVSLALGMWMALLIVLAPSDDTPLDIYQLIAPIFTALVVIASALAVWSERGDLPAVRDGLGRRVAVALVVGGVLVGALFLALSVGPLRGCVPIAPKQLPSGAAPGPGVEDVAGGAKQVIWGAGSDRVEQIVGLSYDGDDAGFDDDRTHIATLQVRGQSAIVYRMGPFSGDRDLAFSWAEEGCDRTVFLAPGTTTEQAQDYAGRY